MIRLVIFDAGGVLYTGNDKIIAKAVRKFLEKHGVHSFDRSDRVWSRIEKLVSIGKIDLTEAYGRWLEGVGLQKDLLAEWMEVDRKEIWGRFRRTPGISKLLMELKKKYVLAVLSDTIASKSKKTEEMEIVGVNHKIFDEIFTSHDLGICKPNRKAFRMALEKFDVKPSEAVFVSDASDELRGAKKIGLVTIGFNCSGGDYNIKKIKEILNILQSLNNSQPKRGKAFVKL